MKPFQTFVISVLRRREHHLIAVHPDVPAVIQRAEGAEQAVKMAAVVRRGNAQGDFIRLSVAVGILIPKRHQDIVKSVDRLRWAAAPGSPHGRFSAALLLRP